jgi:hypothetical protein
MKIMKKEEKLLISMTEEELIKRNKERTKQAIDKGVRILGVITATILFLVSFEVLFEISAFGAIFTRTIHANFWEAARDSIASGGLQLYDDWFGFGVWLPVTIITLILISLAVGLAYLVSIYVKDLIQFIRSILATGGVITKELGTNVKEAMEEEGLKKKKGLFGDLEDPILIKPEKESKESKRGRKSKAELERLLQEQLAKEEAAAKMKIIDISSEIAEIKEEIVIENKVPAKKELSEEELLNLQLTGQDPRVDKDTVGIQQPSAQSKSLFDKINKK